MRRALNVFLFVMWGFNGITIAIAGKVEIWYAVVMAGLLALDGLVDAIRDDE